MKKIKIVREENSFILVDDVKAVVEKLVPHTYKLYVDLTDGEIYIYTRKTITPKLKFIGEIEIRELKLKKHVNLITKEIKQIIEKYTKNRTLMCKTKAIDTYGKDYIATQNHYAETNNPYQKCASNMILYNKDVLEYNYINKD